MRRNSEEGQYVEDQNLILATVAIVIIALILIGVDVARNGWPSPVSEAAKEEYYMVLPLGFRW